MHEQTHWTTEKQMMHVCKRTTKEQPQNNAHVLEYGALPSMSTAIQSQGHNATEPLSRLMQ